MVLRPKNTNQKVSKTPPQNLKPPSPSLRVPPSMPVKEVKGENALADASPPFTPLKSPMASRALTVAVTHPEAFIKVRPVVQIITGQEHLAVYEAERLLDETGLYYVSNGQLVRLVPIQGSMQCEIVNSQTLYVVLSGMIEWHRQARNGEWEVCNPPHNLINTLLFNQDRKHLQTLMGIAHQPYFDANETLVATPGFNPVTCGYARFGVDDYAINAPSMDDAKQAFMSLKSELAEFEFQKPEDLAAAICAMLTAVVRPGLPLAPAFNISAAMSGSGKSFLAKIVVLFATPLTPYITSYPTSENEAIKSIFSVLRERPPVVLFDDMQTDWKPFGAINKALTSHTTTERVLGSSGTGTAQTNALFIGTGNNRDPQKDMRRRVVTIRLAPKSVLKPFEHNPQKQIARYRSVYVGFALTIIQAFLLHGKRDASLTPIGSFEEWSKLCREPIIWLGEPDPASSLINQVKDNTDNEGLAALLKQWRSMYGDEAILVRELIEDAQTKPKLMEILMELPITDRGVISPHKLGQYLKDHRGVRINGLRIEDGKRSERKSWRVLTDDQ